MVIKKSLTTPSSTLRAAMSNIDLQTVFDNAAKTAITHQIKVLLWYDKLKDGSLTDIEVLEHSVTFMTMFYMVTEFCRLSNAKRKIKLAATHWLEYCGKVDSNENAITTPELLASAADAIDLYINKNNQWTDNQVQYGLNRTKAMYS